MKILLDFYLINLNVHFLHRLIFFDIHFYHFHIDYLLSIFHLLIVYIDLLHSKIKRKRIFNNEINQNFTCLACSISLIRSVVVIVVV